MAANSVKKINRYVCVQLLRKEDRITYFRQEKSCQYASSVVGKNAFNRRVAIQHMRKVTKSKERGRGGKQKVSALNPSVIPIATEEEERRG